MPHILVALRSLHPEARKLLEARPDVTVEILDPATPEKVAERLPHCDAIAAGVQPITRELIARSNKLSLVARHGVGYDAIDVPALTERKIPLAVTSGANDISVAEQAMMLLLSVAKSAPRYDRKLREGGWGLDPTLGLVDLLGRTALVVGHGRIGTRVASLMAAFGMKVLVHDPYIPAERIRSRGHAVAPELDAALAVADVVTVHTPANEETRNSWNAARFSKMKIGSIFINTARGHLVVEKDLAAALTGGPLRGAGIDVFQVEPTPKDNPLRGLANLVMSPHIAAATDEGMRRMGVLTIQNILDHFDGKLKPEMVINKEALA